MANTNRYVEYKIEDARSTGSEHLNLNRQDLIELPEVLCQLTQLQSLSLSYNRLRALPEWLGLLTHLQSLSLVGNQLTNLPEELGSLSQLRTLNLDGNKLTELPESLGSLKQLEELGIGDNPLGEIPNVLRRLPNLRTLQAARIGLQIVPTWLSELRNLHLFNVRGNELLQNFPAVLDADSNITAIWFSGADFSAGLPKLLRCLRKLQVIEAADCRLTELPDWLPELTSLTGIWLDRNRIVDLPTSIAQLSRLRDLGLDSNPLNPELAAAYAEGLDAVKRYLRANAGAQVTLNEAKLILIGEGEVGKSSLLGALRGDPWEEGRATTHGIEIKPVKVQDPDTGAEITLNGWDFGGQRVYRPTHQLFFSAPAIYVVVWKPREGPQQGFVKEWINLIKYREPDAKVFVVATHGGPKQRQPDIDRQEIWDLFGKDTVLDFFLVDSKPNNKTKKCSGIANLKNAIAHAAASLPEVGRKIPRRWERTRQALKMSDAAYMSLKQVLKLCRDHKMEEDEAKDFVRISHRLGHLIHYEHDPILQEVVVLKPDWLATAISFVLDDKQTRDARGLVQFSRLSELWNDPARREDTRYDAKLHPLFLRLMERFDLSYEVAIPSDPENVLAIWDHIGKRPGRQKRAAAERLAPNYTSLIAQLVPDVRPPERELNRVWPAENAKGDEQKSQICRIVDAKTGQSAAAEGLFYQLIVRLHKYSLGRVDYKNSVHWQRGLILDDDYNGRALLEHIGNDVRITVRAPYPERLLSVLTYEVKWLVESFWAGLRCDVMVPCQLPCGRDAPGTGLFEVEKLIAFKRQGMQLFPCIVSGCSQAQDIDQLLRNAPGARGTAIEMILTEGFDQIRLRLDGVREQLGQQDRTAQDRFSALDQNDRRIMSQVEDLFTGLMQALTDEAKEGPRLFSFEPVDRRFFERPKWISAKFRVTLWCEHSRLPLTALNEKDDKRGVYELNMPRDWVIKAAPFLKFLSGTLSLVIPVAASATKLVLDEATYKGIEKQLDLDQKSLESVLKGGDKVGGWLGESDAPKLERGNAIRAQGSVLRQLHVWLKEKDPSFGGLVRVQNRRHEFLWVHSRFEAEY